MKKIAAKLFAYWVDRKNQKWINNPLEAQQKTLKFLVSSAQNTTFGKDHNFSRITDYKSFKKQVPIRNYEDIRPYVDRILAGEKNVLWPGQPLYLAKTSGTTSGAKIHSDNERLNAHSYYCGTRCPFKLYPQNGKHQFRFRQANFFTREPNLKKKNGMALGRLSGIVAHYVPSYLQANRMPSWETNCVEDWETKVELIVGETLREKMTLIAGIPSWVQMYFERLIKKEGKPIGEIFPELSLFVYGGVNYGPYRPLFQELIGRPVDSVELFPASEGFFAYQDRLKEEGLLLLLNNGIFYEFIQADTFYSEDPKRISLDQVEVGVNYVLILNTSAGLWGYNIGDTVQFVSTAPFRLVVSGRLKHFISAFGEHVIGKEVESALQQALVGTKAKVREFTVAPQITPTKGLPYHEWFIDFSERPKNMSAFSLSLDDAMRKQNIYYDDLIRGKVLRPVVITFVKEGSFEAYMKSIGKLGGQNKIPKLTNDRSIADKLIQD